MSDQRQQRFTQLLESFSARIGGLLEETGRHRSEDLPVELLDELAGTMGELLIVLTDYQSFHGEDHLTRRVISDAQLLRESIRSRLLQSEQLVAAVGALADEVYQIIREDKRAA